MVPADTNRKVLPGNKTPMELAEESPKRRRFALPNQKMALVLRKLSLEFNVSSMDHVA